MATASQNPELDEENPSGSGSDFSDESNSDGNSDVETDSQPDGKEPCKHYNGKGCKAEKCSYLHVCKYALTGSCRYGSKCKLNHPGAARESSGESDRPADQSASSETKLTDGRCYQWQLNDGNCWLDVSNDHVLEAQYSLPHNKGIQIYNTPYGKVSIDFKRMRVLVKSLRVRRLDDGQTVWIWYCILGEKWIKYGDKQGSKHSPSPVKSCDIEKKFQSDPAGAYTFTIGADTFEIKFKEMRQVTAKKKKRRVTRRPLYRTKVSSATSALQTLSLDGKPKWQFEGEKGAWHDFKRRQGTRTECSVTSDEIEREYMRNPAAGMTFNVNGNSYKLDFQAMTQINLKTYKSRQIRRV